MPTAIEAQIAELQARNDELRREVSVLHRFIDTLQTLVESLDQPGDDSELMGALSASLASALTVLGAAHGELLVLEEERDELVAVLGHGEVASEPWRAYPAGAGIAGWVLRRVEPVIANEAPADERFDPAVDQPPGLAAEKVLIVPVVGRDRALGVIRVVHRAGARLFDEDAQTLVSLMGCFAGELLAGMAERHAPDAPPPAAD